MRVAKTHFSTTLAKQNQPDTMTVHIEFLRRTQAGPARFAVKDVKMGRQTSIVHITLSQDGQDEVVGYFTQTNLRTESGASFQTGWTLHPAPYPVDLAALRKGRDAAWKEQASMPFASFRKATQHVRFCFPRRGQRLKSLNDEWVSFRNGDRFTQEALGFVADMWPQIVESYRHSDDPYATTAEQPAMQDTGFGNFWYPTVLLNLDVKKALPPEGVEWLFARVQAKKIQNGRLDLEVVILDETGDVVALSHHVVLVLPASRNLAKRNKGGDGKIKL